MRLKWANLIQRWLPILSALCITVALSARVQEAADDAQTIEDDYRVTRVDERRHAVAELRKTAHELRASGHVIEAVRTLNRVGRFQIRMYVADEAIQTFQQALQLLEQQPDVQAKVDSLNGLASSYDNLSKCDLAEPSANTAIALSTQTNYLAGKAEALLTLSHCQNHRDHALAMKSAQESLGLWLSLDRKRGIAEAHLAIGEYQMAQNDLLESGKSLQTALSIYRELGAIDQQATILIHLGFLEYRNGAWQDALGFYTNAQSLIDQKSEPYRMAQITGGLGEAFLESGLPEVALAKFREGLNYFQLSKAQRGVRAMIWSIGRAQYMSGNYRDALESLQKARLDAASANDPALTAFCDDFLGRVYYALNDYAAALSHFQAALEGYEKAGNRMERARTLALMGQVYEGQGALDKAWKNYETAIKMFRALADRVNESATLYAMGSLKLRENDLNTAESYLQQSIDVTENIRRVSRSNDLAVAFSASVHDRYEAYIECLMRKHYANPTEGLDVRAFEMSELARGRSLAELLRNTQTNLVPGLDLQLAEQENSLRRSLRVKEDYRVTLLGRSYKKEDLDSVETELARLESEYQQVTASIRAKYPAYEQITRPTVWTLPQIQKRVVADDQTLLLEYSLGARRSYVWAVSPTEFSSYELPGRLEIESEVRRFYDLLTANQPIPGLTLEQQQERVRQAEAQLPAVTASLSKLLLGPLADKLGTKRLLIVADGPLQYIPFQALFFPVETDLTNSGSNAIANQRLLFRDHEIINEPSASILEIVLSESAKREPPSRSVAVLADPVFESDDPRITSATKPTQGTAQIHETEFHQALRDVNLSGDGHIPRLLASRGEADAIMSVAPWRSAFGAMDFEASRATVMKANLGDYRIVHFATHGLLNNEHPELSGIVLSLFDRNGQPQDGYLRLHDIYNLKLPVDLVVLSACNTGLGKDVKGEGLIGLTRGFMYAGASTVIASLWKVDDEATAELMRLFYGYMLADGLSPAAALRKAQVTMSQQKRWQSPYYWAGFVIQGQYNQPERTNRFPTSHLALWLFGAAIICAASFYVLKRRRKQIV